MGGEDFRSDAGLIHFQNLGGGFAQSVFDVEFGFRAGRRWFFHRHRRKRRPRVNDLNRSRRRDGIFASGEKRRDRQSGRQTGKNRNFSFHNSTFSFRSKAIFASARTAFSFCSRKSGQKQDSFLKINAPSTSEKPQNNRQNQANKNAGDDWKVQAEVSRTPMNVAGQSPQPAFAKASPNQKTDGRNAQPDDYQNFAEVVQFIQNGLLGLVGVSSAGGGGRRRSPRRTKQTPARIPPARG